MNLNIAVAHFFICIGKLTDNTYVSIFDNKKYKYKKQAFSFKNHKDTCEVKRIDMKTSP